MSKTLNFQDRLNMPDTIQVSRAKSKRAPTFRTEIIGGYGLRDGGLSAKSELDEVLFEEHNETVLGGAIFTLEKLFGVESPLTVDYLNNIMGIATTGAPVTDIYPKETVVCLFGVGIGGSGDTISSVHEVKFQQRELVDMIPLRVTSDPLSSTDTEKYWFKRLRQDGKTEYFLKNFESKPVIKVLWRDGEGGEDGSEVEAGVENSTRTDGIESFIEIIIKVSKVDGREYFEINGNVEQTRVNTLGLFTGIKRELADGTIDYKQVKLFSALNFNNEMLVSEKDLTMIYRIYTS